MSEDPTEKTVNPYCRKCSNKKCGKYHVYVIELEPRVLSERKFARENRNARYNPPCYYVGSTKHKCDCRLGQHMCFAEGEDTYICTCGGKMREIRFLHAGGRTRGNRYAGKYGKGLRPDLFSHLNPITDKNEAIRIEYELAEYLKRTGAAVWQR